MNDHPGEQLVARVVLLARASLDVALSWSCTPEIALIVRMEKMLFG